MTPPWLLVDFSWLLHRASHAMQGLSHGDMQTGVIYGFFEQLRTLCFDPRLKSNRIAIFVDSRQSFRKQTFPDYKRTREQDRTDEDRERLAIMHEQGDLLRGSILPEIGIPTYRQTGLESDDLMALAANAIEPLESVGLNAVIITADGDLYQCITEGVHWYDPSRNAYYDPTTFRQDKGIEPHQWWRVKAIAGCHSDNVPGVGGVGEESAIAYIMGLLPHRFKKYETIESNQDVIRKNAELVRLPHIRTKAFRLKEPAYDAKAFMNVCERYGMNSYLEGAKALEWAAIFAGDLTKANRQAPRVRGESRLR